MSAQFAGVCCLWACRGGRARSLVSSPELPPHTRAYTFFSPSLPLPFLLLSISLRPLGPLARVKGDICAASPSVNSALIGYRYRVQVHAGTS